MKVVKKEWGEEIWLSLTDKYCFKIIKINQGCRCSLQYHEKKSETNYIHEGQALVTMQREGTDVLYQQELGPGSVIDIPCGRIHRFYAIENLTMFEVSTPEVEDVIRVEDDYGRDKK